MNLDGLNSKYQMNIPIISKNGSVQLSPYQIRKYSVSFPKQLLHKRGVYIVDCILSGYQTQATCDIYIEFGAMFSD